MNTLDPTPVLAVVEPSAEPPALDPASDMPARYVHAKGAPMTRHVAHKTKANKTACGLSLSRMRAATAEETARLGICSFCEPAARVRKQKARR